jgi:hypothetical protein
VFCSILVADGRFSTWFCVSLCISLVPGASLHLLMSCRQQCLFCIFSILMPDPFCSNALLTKFALPDSCSFSHFSIIGELFSVPRLSIPGRLCC